MSLTFTRTKVIVPKRRGELLTRHRLIDQINRTIENKLITIIAPAGYGKTALMIDFAHQSVFKVCWYSLDELDVDLQRFLTHFVAAVAQQFPAFGANSTNILSSVHSMTMEQVAAVIVNDIYEHVGEHVVLVLDDYHLVNKHPKIDEFVSQFLQHAGENCHVILCSRRLLSLPELHLLVARSQVSGIGYEALAFTPPEIQMLVLQNYHLSMPDQEAQELAQQTEGWVTGLLLTAQTMWHWMLSAAQQAQYSQAGLYDYLAQEVLEQQPLQVQEFLLRSSFLDEFNIELCQAIWGSGEDWNMLFEATASNNLFVLAVDAGGKWLRYHNLFQEFLQTRFEHLYPAELKPLLHKIARAYIERVEWEKAWLIYQRLDDMELAANLVEAAGPHFLKTGRLERLIEWCQALPKPVLVKHPGLLSLNGIAQVIQGRVEAGLPDLDTAAAAQEAGGDLAGLAQTLVRRTFAHRVTGDYRAAQADAQRALEIARQLGLQHLKAEALKAIGVNLNQQRKSEEGVLHLLAALHEYQMLEDQHNVSLVMLDLGMAYANSGKYQDALTNYQQVLSYWRKTSNLYTQANVLNNLGSLHHQLGEYEQALIRYEEGLAIAKQSGAERLQAFILSGIGDLYKDLAAGEESHAAYQQAQAFAHKTGDRFLLLYIALAQADLARLEGSLGLAQRFFSAGSRAAGQGASAYEQGLSLLLAGKLAIMEQRFPEAIHLLTQAVDLFSQAGQILEEARSRFYLAWAYGLAGDEPAASNQLWQAFEAAGQIDSGWVLAPAGLEAKQWLERVQKLPENKRLVKKLLAAVEGLNRQLPDLRRRLRRRSLTVPLSPPRYKIRALGGVEVEKDQEPVRADEWVHQRRVREVFFYLLSRPEGATRETICSEFWPESSIDELRLQFKNVIYRLRFALGKDVVVLEDNRYRFNTAIDYEHDVEAFRTHLADAEQAADSRKKLAALQAAVATYTGPYFPEAEGSWVMPLRANLEKAFFKAANELIELLLAGKDYPAALKTCERVLAEDRANEDAHCLAMRAYAGLGERGSVIRQYEMCLQALQKELGVEPSIKTRDLYQVLIR